ncbi:hypothetical protein PQR46_38120 [Paraburkholderia sediminicola]
MLLNPPACRRVRRSRGTKNGAPFAGRAVFLCSKQRKAFVVQQRMQDAPRTSGSGKKNPGLSPGKRYAIQRIGAFGHVKPCERQRHDAVACTLLLQSRRPSL